MKEQRGSLLLDSPTSEYRSASHTKPQCRLDATAKHIQIIKILFDGPAFCLLSAKSPEDISLRGFSKWLRRLDLNQRPSD